MFIITTLQTNELFYSHKSAIVSDFKHIYNFIKAEFSAKKRPNDSYSFTKQNKKMY